jgi:hypothetical protein
MIMISLLSVVFGREGEGEFPPYGSFPVVTRAAVTCC